MKANISAACKRWRQTGVLRSLHIDCRHDAAVPEGLGREETADIHTGALLKPGRTMYPPIQA